MIEVAPRQVDGQRDSAEGIRVKPGLIDFLMNPRRKREMQLRVQHHCTRLLLSESVMPAHLPATHSHAVIDGKPQTLMRPSLPHCA